MAFEMSDEKTTDLIALTRDELKQVQREAMLSILRLFGDDAADCDCENCKAARTARKMIENL